jgi:hypothetical protein
MKALTAAFVIGLAPLSPAVAQDKPGTKAQTASATEYHQRAEAR